MHELLLWGLPLIGAPLLALRLKMARHATSSEAVGGLAIGQRLDNIRPLPAATGTPIDLLAAGKKATVVVFMANRCPGVKAYDGRLKALAQRFSPSGVQFIGVNSIPEQFYPREGLEGMGKAAKDRGFAFPYVKDAEQRLMRRLGAVSTPQVFVLDEENVLRYKGRIDDAFIESKARQHDLRDALNDVLARRPVANPETHAIGCAIDIAGPASAPPASPITRSLPA